MTTSDDPYGQQPPGQPLEQSARWGPWPDGQERAREREQATPQPLPLAVPTVQYQPVTAASVARNGVATASLVLGITSIIFCWWGIATLAQVVLAITFGAIGIQRANENGAGKGMAVAGLVCGSVGAVAYLIFGIATLGAGFLI